MAPTAADFDRVRGTEFDWFALDRAGAIALFSTAGFGEIPTDVMRHALAHRTIAERLDALTRNAAETWPAYAQLGLFVFDWQHWAGPYRREATPSLLLEVELRREILRIPQLPKLDTRFDWAHTVTVPRFTN